MTGYATSCSNSLEALSAEKTADTMPTINIEIRSVNSRFLDLHFRLPDEIRASEPALRSLISTKVKRGKVELRITIGQTNPQIVTQIPAQALQNLARFSDIVRNWLPDVIPLTVHDVLKLSQTPIVLEEVQEQILATASLVLTDFLKSREREGAKLAKSILERTAALRALVAQVQPMVPEIVEQQRQRFLERWQQALQQTQLPSGHTTASDSIQERALAEATAFAMRIDVAEELTRLNSHLDEIDRLLAKGGETGKRLDFIIQELHREANTLGSKSANISLTQISVEMKVLIEQMREQVQNIE